MDFLATIMAYAYDLLDILLEVSPMKFHYNYIVVIESGLAQQIDYPESYRAYGT